MDSALCACRPMMKEGVIPVPELDFTSRIPIAKGWSEDKKHCMRKPDGTKYLLRISAAERYENRKGLFSMLQKVERLGPACGAWPL